MKRTIDSQIPGSPHSLSLLSEPPDITNWFPSYEYESFVLDTYDGLGGSQFRESETERSGSLLVGEIDNKKERFSEDSERKGLVNDKFESQISNEMLDSSNSASLLSEPPQIKNWFSSYEYESPMSDDEDLKVSATQESDSDKDESPMKGCQSRKEENFEELSNSGKKNEEGEGEELLPSRPLLKELLGEVIYKKPCCKGKGVVDEENFSQDIVHRQREHCLDDTSANHGTYLTENIGTSRMNDERPQLEKKQTQNFPGKAGFLSFKTEEKLSRFWKSPSKLVYELNENIEPNLENESAFISSGNNAQLIEVGAAATRQATPKFNNKENGEQEGLRDGFATTKKSRVVRSNNEYSSDSNVEILLACSNNKRTSLEGDQDKNGVVRRKVLSERTNFEQTVAAMEVTGKWKCPQKGKPMIRPLKQLRLEQWICRHQ